MTEAKDRKQERFELVAWVALALWAAAILAPIGQAIGWLRTGEWGSYSLRKLVGAPLASTEWKGFNLLLNWVADLHISIICIAVSTAMFMWLTASEKK